MRKILAGAALALTSAVAVAGFSTAASAATVKYNPSATSYCNFNPADPQCHQTPPGAPGFCGPTSFGFHGNCTPDTPFLFRFRKVA